MKNILPTELDSTISALQEGVLNLARNRAIEEVEGWQKKLHETENPELVPIGDRLEALAIELRRESLDGEVIAGIMRELSEGTRRVAGESTGAAVSEKLEKLAILLEGESDSLAP